LLQVVEDKDRLLERVQRQLEQLLRERYGPKRERIDENQLFLYAAQIVAASQARAAAEATPTDSAGKETRGDAPALFAKLHSRNQTPALAVVVYAVLMWVLAVTGTFLWVAALGAAAEG
jgi:hypothetical protein